MRGKMTYGINDAIMKKIAVLLYRERKLLRICSLVIKLLE